MTSGERRAALATAAVLAGAAIGGCGGDDPADTYPSGVSRPIAKVRFLREADRICASTNARIEAAGDDLIGGRSDAPPAEVKRVVLGVAIPALEAEVRAIRALGAPAGDEREVEAIVAATRDGMTATRVLDARRPGRGRPRPRAGPPGRDRASFDFLPSVCCAISDDEEAAYEAARRTICFYATVRTYAPLWEMHGFGELSRGGGERLPRGEFAAMPGLVPDEMVDTYCAAGPLDKVRARVEQVAERGDGIWLGPPTYFIAPEEIAVYQQRIVEAFAPGR